MGEGEEDQEKIRVEVLIDKKVLEEAESLSKKSDYKTLSKFTNQALKLMLFSEKTKDMFSGFPSVISNEQKEDKAEERAQENK